MLVPMLCVSELAVFCVSSLSVYIQIKAGSLVGTLCFVFHHEVRLEVWLVPNVECFITKCVY